MLSQVQLRGLETPDGVLEPDAVAAAVRPPDPYQPKSCLVSMENTHNAAGGVVWPLKQMAGVAEVARAHGLPVMLDGARIFNACVAAGVKPSEYAQHCDIVTVSLYKGLAAPMGSLVCGSRELIERAWTFRRIFGGALRQAGIVAAAGIVAMDTMVDRLAEDHDNARRLAAGLAGVVGEAVDAKRVQTNMVVYRTPEAGDVLRRLREARVLAGLIGPGAIRFVTHKDVDAAAIDRAVAAFAEIAG
jgi:threonine aldolase